jgi:hypothetical protein
MSRFGRLPATDDKHLIKYPFRLAMPRTVETAENTLDLPHEYRPKYNQGNEGACGGFSGSWAGSIDNHRYYDARWLYKEAQKIDEWPGEDYEGTSVRAVLDVLKDVGHRRIYRGISKEASPAEGISEFRWALTVDEVRTALAGGRPVILGIEWFDVFDKPEKRGHQWWLPEPIGYIAGGHAICCYGVSDRRQAVKLVNSWGSSYPLTWLPYATLEKLLRGFEYPGEAAVIMDR